MARVTSELLKPSELLDRFNLPKLMDEERTELSLLSNSINIQLAGIFSTLDSNILDSYHYRRDAII